MTTQHTPGPWAAHHHEATDTYTIHVAGRSWQSWAVAHVWDCFQDEANARLMAAAPDLLEALKAIMEMLDDEIKTSTDEQLAFGLTDPACPENVKTELRCVIACRAAIAKAEGKV